MLVVSSLIACFFMQSITHEYKTCIISHDDAIHLQTGTKSPMEVDWLKVHSKWIAVNVHSVWMQTMQINLLPMHIIFIVWTHLYTTVGVCPDEWVWLRLMSISQQCDSFFYFFGNKLIYLLSKNQTQHLLYCV